MALLIYGFSESLIDAFPPDTVHRLVIYIRGWIIFIVIHIILLKHSWPFMTFDVWFLIRWIFRTLTSVTLKYRIAWGKELLHFDSQLLEPHFETAFLLYIYTYKYIFTFVETVKLFLLFHVCHVCNSSQFFIWRSMLGGATVALPDM